MRCAVSFSGILYLKVMQHTQSQSVPLPPTPVPTPTATIGALPRWASLGPHEVYSALNTAPTGLTEEEALHRTTTEGFNAFVPERGGGWLRAVSIVARPLFLPLWIAAGLMVFLGRQWTLTALVLAAVANMVVAIWQERKAEHAVERLNEDLPAYARVLRDGNEHLTPLTDIVPGDVLPLKPGEWIPADARVVEADNLHVVNRVLWGDVPPQKVLSDSLLPDEFNGELARNVVLAGSRVTSGTGRAVVFATGLRTAFGGIATLTERAHEEPSPLLLVFRRLGWIVTLLALAATLSGAVVGQLKGLEAVQVVYLVAALLVAVVPVGLMPGATVILAQGARRLRARGARVRRLSSVETLGATTVICADKTGTLTQNEMTVREAWTNEGVVAFTGVGYTPRGNCVLDNHTLTPHQATAQLGDLLRAAILTASAKLLPPDTIRAEWHIAGDPVDAAHLVAAAKVGMVSQTLLANSTVLADVLPLPGAQLKGVVVQHAGQTLAIFRGKPRNLLERCTHLATSKGERPLTADDRRRMNEQLQRQEQGLMHTVALAQRRVETTATTLDAAMLARDLVFLGWLAVVDPPRTEVSQAFETVHGAGIRTIMLTADEPLGAESVARRCGITNDHAATITGPELAQLSQAALRERLRHGNLVLAKLSPQQKVDVVETLDAMGEVVLVTGTSANDVPAIKAADIGVAFGKTGSPAAREVADVIFENDDFAPLSLAITIGRGVEQQLRRLIALGMATTGVKLGALLLTLAFGWPLLLTIGQMLLIDVLAGVLPALAFAATPVNPQLMQRRPRPSARPLIIQRVYVLGYGWFLLLGLLPAILGVGLTLAFSAARRLPLITQFAPFEARLMAEASVVLSAQSTTLYVVLGMAGLLGGGLILRSGRHLPKSRRAIILLTVLVVLAVLLGLVYVPALKPYLQFTPLAWWGWVAALATFVGTALTERLRQRLDREPDGSVG